TGLKNTRFEKCKLKNAVFSGIRTKPFEFDGCDLSAAEWANSLLKDVDFTSDNIDGGSFIGHELHGAIVNAMQACELAKLLGVRIQ
ncbi:MAG: pentapeptide repeat-containing protein, partial [Oscillospiraceae bacterium]